MTAQGIATASRTDRPTETPPSLPVRHAAGMSLTRSSYTSADVFDHDRTTVFGRNWLFAGHTADIPRPGDFRVVDLAGEQVILWRGKDGVIRAHFNVCRHRGSRLTWQTCGTAASLQCPYHQWTYRPDGALAGARLMGDGFRRQDYPLIGVALEVLGGLIFVCPAVDPPPFDDARASIEPQLAPHGLDGAQIVRRETYDVRANWKTVVENNRECYHCRVSHPEFTSANYDVGLPGDTRMPAEYRERLAVGQARWHAMGLEPRTVDFPAGSWFRVARMPLRQGFLTETADGALAAPLMGRLPDADVGSLRLIGLPNFWAHANADHASTTRLDPVAPDRTRVEVTFLVRGDARPGVDCDVDKVCHVLQRTFEQDIELCESVAAGLTSRAWLPGPYSPLVEASVDMFHSWYLQQADPQRPATEVRS